MCVCACVSVCVCVCVYMCTYVQYVRMYVSVYVYARVSEYELDHTDMYMHKSIHYQKYTTCLEARCCHVPCHHCGYHRLVRGRRKRGNQVYLDPLLPH